VLPLSLHAKLRHEDVQANPGNCKTMGNRTVTMHDVNGKTHAISDAEDGISLMELAKRHGVAGIMGDCGGGCACATCHLYVDAAWWDKVGEPDEIEFAMLDMVTDVQRETSRLGCQIKVSADLDGIEVTVAPSSGY
jgi:ferredoxin, 2Fe-2S